LVSNNQIEKPVIRGGQRLLEVQTKSTLPEFLRWPDFRQRDEKMMSCSLFQLKGPKNN
jgi:hypothetical protein